MQNTHNQLSYSDISDNTANSMQYLPKLKSLCTKQLARKQISLYA